MNSAVGSNFNAKFTFSRTYGSYEQYTGLREKTSNADVDVQSKLRFIQHFLHRHIMDPHISERNAVFSCDRH